MRGTICIYYIFPFHVAYYALEDLKHNVCFGVRLIFTYFQFVMHVGGSTAQPIFGASVFSIPWYDVKAPTSERMRRLSVDMGIEKAGLQRARSNSWVINPGELRFLERWDYITITALIFVLQLD